MSSNPTHVVTPAHQGSRDFWKFWIGQSISSLGSSFTSFALPLLVFKLTGSALNLAFNVTAGILPYFLFGLVIGAWVDRVNRKQMMVFTDLARALVTASIPLLAALGLLSIWWIYMVTFTSSTLTICFEAANFAAIPSLVNQDNLVTANGRVQASYATTRVMGPLLAGLLVAIMPLSTLLLVDALSFLISACSLVIVRTSFNADSDKKATNGIYQDIRGGLSYMLGNPVLRWLTLLLLLINFVEITVITQTVVFAKQWLHASDTQVGLLYSSGSVGAIVFSLLAGGLRKRLSFSSVILGSLVLEGLFCAAPSLTHWYWVALLFLGLRGGVSILFNINAYSLSQTIVPNDLLGRVIIFTRVLTWSTASIGALLGGAAIERTKNVGLVYAVVGMLVFLIALAFLFTPLGHAERYLPKEM